MALVIDTTVKTFDMTQVKRSDLVRLRKAGDVTYRNGFVTDVTPNLLTVMYSNVQNFTTSFLKIPAVEVAAGMWEVYWTTDMQTINYQPADDSVTP